MAHYLQESICGPYRRAGAALNKVVAASVWPFSLLGFEGERPVEIYKTTGYIAHSTISVYPAERQQPGREEHGVYVHGTPPPSVPVRPAHTCFCCRPAGQTDNVTILMCIAKGGITCTDSDTNL